MKIGTREFLFLLLLAALPLAAWKFVFEPRNAQIHLAREQIAIKRAKLDQLKQATEQINDLGAEIERLSHAVVHFERKLPEQREVEVILKEVWQLASRHGLTPRSIRTDEPVKNAHYAELPLRMTIDGDFDGLYSFLLDLEKLQRITRLPHAQIEKVSKEEGRITAELVLSIFYEPRDVDGAQAMGG